MKRLTLSQVAGANLRINRKAYTSLFLGILLAVFLATATSLCAWGTVRGHEEQMAERVGWMDMILLGNESATDEQLRRCGFFREIGHVTVNACVEGTEIHAGYYDETAARLMNRTLSEGRMPEKPGEIAAERSALIRIDYGEAEAGDTLTLTMHPVYGVSEEKTFQLTGILNEQTDYLQTFSDEEGMHMPALLVSPEESYAVGSAVVHRVLTYAPLITYNQVVRNCPVFLSTPYGISREEGAVVYYDSGWERAQKTLMRILMWAVLGAALMLSACVGIASAMESLLARKTEDIGMLRAIGATRRQIRRIYGAEAWLLTATALPAGLLAGILTAWIVSRIAPGQVAFSLNLWLLFPILGLSALCVFIASRLPLYHASRRMPMGVLRDSTLLRKAGKVRSRRSFRPDRLIAGRRTRLHPLRQAGAAGMIALTLLSTLMMGELALGLHIDSKEDMPAFQLYGTSFVQQEPFTQPISADDMTREDLRRIAAVPGVERVRSITEFTANLLVDEVPEYFRSYRFSFQYPDGSAGQTTISALENFWTGSEWLFYTEEDLPEAEARRYEDYEADMSIQTYRQMGILRARLRLSEIPVPVRVYAADLDYKALEEYVSDGAIDPEKLERGEHALVFAPEVCAKEEEEGGYDFSRWMFPQEIRDGEWDLVIRNDAFTSGMELNLLELAVNAYDTDETPVPVEEPYQSAEAVRAAVTVGAVLSGPAMLNDNYLGFFSVILSSKGAEALGFRLPGPASTDVYLAGNPTAEEESEIENRISQIAMNSWTQVDNRIQLAREYRAKKLRQILLFAALILLFFTVSVFMQVSGASRQIRSEIRTIGTLRAVGADLKTLVGCYRLPVWVSTAAALVPCLLFYALSHIPALRVFRDNHPLIIVPALILLAGCIALSCIAGIRGRLADVSRQTIVDNIREL